MFKSYMNEAMLEAKKAFALGEVPVGAVIVEPKVGKIIARGHNQTKQRNSPLWHAEIIAIEEACKFYSSDKLNDMVIYTTLEPCIMCMGAISHARIARLYYAMNNPNQGSCSEEVNIFQVLKNSYYIPEIYQEIGFHEVAELMTKFFNQLR